MGTTGIIFSGWTEYHISWAAVLQSELCLFVFQGEGDIGKRKQGCQKGWQRGRVSPTAWPGRMLAFPMGPKDAEEDIGPELTCCLPPKMTTFWMMGSQLKSL